MENTILSPVEQVNTTVEIAQATTSKERAKTRVIVSVDPYHTGPSRTPSTKAQHKQRKAKRKAQAQARRK